MWSTTETLPTTFTFNVESTQDHTRVDRFISKQLPQFSRTFIQKLIDQEHITVNNKIAKSSTIIKPEDDIVIQVPAEKPPFIYTPTPEEKSTLESLDVQVIHKEADFMVVNKPFNLLVHRPFLHAKDITLVDWLIYTRKEISDVGNPERPGIVHRLDKDTSGLIIIPLNNFAHTTFSNMFKNRTLTKTYYALVEGHPLKEGVIDLPVGRDPFVRNRMATHGIEPRESTTHYKVVQYFKDTTLVEVNPITGRTHQIRVHFKALGHPLLGDTTYGKASKVIGRHALHATKLNFTFNGKDYSLESDLPSDFKHALEKLEN